MPRVKTGKGKGWWGNPDGHKAAGEAAGAAILEKYGIEHMRNMGKKGGVKRSEDREAMAAMGRNGGKKVSQDRDHMRSIGIKGAAARKKNREAALVSSGG